MPVIKPHAKIFEQHRDMMFGIAYRMLGSVSDAEDIVQDAWFRWRDVALGDVLSPRAWLATAVSRLCVDKLRRRKIERLNYRGPWLPEPVVLEETTDNSDPETQSSMAENISIAFLFMLEQLSPLERAVVILKEAFDLPHDEIASMLDIEAPWSRQLLRRARNKLGREAISVNPQPDDNTKAVMASFLDAVVSGDLESLHGLLTEDIVAYSDGGGKASAALLPIEGTDKIIRLFLSLVRKSGMSLSWEWKIINGEWGLVLYEDQVIHSVTTAEVTGGRIRRIYTMRNPDKLRQLS